MKKIVAFLTATAILFSFVGCKKKEIDPGLAAGKNGKRVNYNYNMSDYVTLGNYLGITVDKTSDAYKNYANSYYSDLVANADAYIYIKEGVLAKDDTAMIEFVGRIDGKEFEGGKSNAESPLTLGSNSFIPGFEDALIGKSIGKTEVITVTFPDDYDQTTYFTDDTKQENGFSLKGKKAEFTVTINSKRVLPQQNDETAKKLGFASNDELLKDTEKIVTETIIRDTITSSNGFAVKSFPETEKARYDEIYNEVVSLAQQQASEYNAQYGTEVDAETMLYYMYGYTSDNLKSYYQDVQKIEIILYAIFDAENLTFTEQEYNDFLSETAKQNSTSDETVTVEMVKEEYEAWQLEAMIVTELAMKYLVKSAVIK